MAQPETTRHGAADFSHYAQLPVSERTGVTATVLIGQFQALTSRAHCDTPIGGVDRNVRGVTTLALDAHFEHALIVLSGAPVMGGAEVTPGHWDYLAPGQCELRLEARGETRTVLIGGESFDESLVMWWNFVAQSRDEIDAADASWRWPDGRCGTVNSLPTRIETPAPSWQRDRDARNSHTSTTRRAWAPRWRLSEVVISFVR